MNRHIKLFVLELLFSVTLSGQQANGNNESLSSNPDSVAYTIVTEMPKFGKNQNSLQQFVKMESNLKTSKTRTPTTNNVFIQIIIEKDGSVVFDKIARGSDNNLNKEAIRIVENMPNWTAGKNADGSSARVVMMLPIWFK